MPHPVHEDVLRFIGDPSADSFERLALEVFAHQFTAVDPYRRWCVGRGASPESISDWRHIPPVPIEAFKSVDLCCAPPERVFRSTGTTQGAQRRSRHLMPDLRLYRSAAVYSLRSFLFADIERIRIVSLIEPASERPDSSLAQMVAWAIETFADQGSGYAVDERGLDRDRLIALLRESERSGHPCCVMTTTGTLIRVLDDFNRHGLAFRLPHGSRLMDTGGDKGAPRHLSRNGLLHACWSAFAIPGYFSVNEYGMAEMASQFYDNVIADRLAGRHRARFKVSSHWVRTLVLDPTSLAPLPPGTPGLLCHFDLANAGTAMAVLSEDVGRAVDGGFELLGRVPHAEVRGCSLSLAEWP